MKVLFLCVANSARSQIAEGLARKILGPGHQVESAGSHPTRVHPLTLEILREIGIDGTGQRSKSVSELSSEFLSQLDFVVLLCAEESCPLPPSKARVLSWPLPDPALSSHSPETQKERFREIREELSRRLREFLRNPPAKAFR